MSPSEKNQESASTLCDVHLVGRMGGGAVERELPSGDIVSTFTVVIDRAPRRGSRVVVDAIPCQAFPARLRARVARLAPGVVVDVEGTLRRRFWRAPSGLGSALELDVRSIRMLD
jgi:single-strand DNA-binding protein